MQNKTKTFKIPEVFYHLFILTIVLVIISLVAYSLKYLEKSFTKETGKVSNFISISDIISEGYAGNYGSPLIKKSKTFNESAQALEPKVLAATTTRLPAYKAQLVRQSYSQVNIPPGKSITLEATFKNTGQAIWKNSGLDIVALQPRRGRSVFKDDFWYSSRIAGKMKEKKVSPGEKGHFRFALKAPAKEEWYTEEFILVTNNHSVLGSVLKINFKVGNPTPYFQAEEVARAYESINLEPGKAITFWVDLKNTGQATWRNDGEHFVALNTTDPAHRVSPFRHEYWNEYNYRPARLDQKEVKPGETGRFTFALKAPQLPGNYVENFHLVAENLTWFTSGHLSIPIKVEINTETPTVNQKESKIRVGLYYTDEPIQITGSGSYIIRDSEGNNLATMGREVISEISFSDGLYTLTSENINLTTDKYLRFIPEKRSTIMEIVNYENKPLWNLSLNDNLFRGKIEIRYAEDTGRLWVINELPLESYLRGLAEAGNDNPPEYLKALISAARSYAQYHINTYRKHAAENFHVDATYDQVYRGYNFELRTPHMTEAEEATRGMMVTYNDEVVVTPYYSRADGRTRSWEEVWAGGPYPWLVSVPDPWSEGDTLWGHGVGMPAGSARAQAEEGKTYEEILKYYYTGTEIKEIY